MRPKDLISTWVRIFHEADADKLAALYHDDAINHQGANEPVKGKNAIRDMFRNEFTSAEMHCIVENIFENGKWAILNGKITRAYAECMNSLFHNKVKSRRFLPERPRKKIIRKK